MAFVVGQLLEENVDAVQVTQKSPVVVLVLYEDGEELGSVKLDAVEMALRIRVGVIFLI